MTFADDADGIDIHPTSIIVLEIATGVFPSVLPQFAAPPATLSVFQDALSRASPRLWYCTPTLAQVEGVHSNHSGGAKRDSLTSGS